MALCSAIEGPAHANVTFALAAMSWHSQSSYAFFLRLGLLVCFYNNVHQLGASDARNLLHQLIKCNQLRGSQLDVQKVRVLDTV